MTELKEEVDRISTEVSAQETLLDQALAAIANKAAGGGGGGSVETCTVTVNFASKYGQVIAATTYVDGAISNFAYAKDSSDVTSVTVENVVCGSTFGFDVGSAPFYRISGDTMKYIIGYSGFLMFSAPTNAGASESITLSMD